MQRAFCVSGLNAMSSYRNEERAKSHTAGTWALIYRSCITGGVYFRSFICSNFLVECEATCVSVRFLPRIHFFLPSPLTILWLFFVKFLTVFTATFVALTLPSISFSWVQIFLTLIFWSKCIFLRWRLSCYIAQSLVRCVWYALDSLATLVHPAFWSVFNEVKAGVYCASFFMHNRTSANIHSPFNTIRFVFGTSTTP